MMCKPRHFEVCRSSELGVPDGSTSSKAARSEVTAEVVLRHDLEGFLENFP